MKILYINQPLCNRGDESAQRAFLKALLRKKNDLEITSLFIDTYSEASIKQFDIKDSRAKYISLHTNELYRHFHLKLWKNHLQFLSIFNISALKIRKYYKNCDWVVCSPGGISMGGFQSWEHIYLLSLAKYYSKKLAYYGRSFGPFPEDNKSQRKFKNISYKLINSFDFLSIRDKKTEDLATQLNVQYTPTVDCAFLEKPIVDIPYEVKQLLGERSYMVFVPNLLIWHYGYKGKISKETVIDFYNRILKDMLEFRPECNVVMLPQTFDYYSEEDDVNLFREIAEIQNDPRVIVVPDCYSSDVQQTIINKCKLLIGARYHSVVFSINQVVPFIALSYEHKISGLLQTLKKEDCMVDITNTFDNRESIDTTISCIRAKMHTAFADEVAQKKALYIAEQCLDKFIETLNT